MAALAGAFLFTGLRMELRWQRGFVIPGDLALAKQAADWYRQQPRAPAYPVALDHPDIAKALGVDVFDRWARSIFHCIRQRLNQPVAVACGHPGVLGRMA